jgi:hypothetical protein
MLASYCVTFTKRFYLVENGEHDNVNADPLFIIGLSCGAYVATLFNPSTPFSEARFSF